MTGTDGETGIPDEMGPVDRSPSSLSSALALAAASAAVMVSPASTAGLLVSLAGIAGLAAGLVTGRRRLVRLAGAALVGAVLLAGAAGAAVLATLTGVTAALLAFDLGTTAVDLGAQLGRETPTRRLELVHAAASTLVGAAFVLAGFAVHEYTTGGQPLSAVVGLVVAVVVLLAALRRADPVR